MKQVWRGIICVLLIFSCSSCFKIGLPEYYSASNAKISKRSSSPRPKAIVLVDSKKIDQRHQRNSLGYQFAFIFFPLTSLNYPYGEYNLFVELTADRLRYKGYQPVIVTRENLTEAQEVVAADIVVEPNFKSLSLNAYDLFFFRKLSLKADLELSYYKQNLNKAYYTNRFQMFHSKIRPFASAQALGFFLEKELSERVDLELEKDMKKHVAISERLKRQAMENLNRVSSLFIVAPPSLGDGVYISLEPHIRSSYGFKDLPEFSASQVQRMFQKGIEKSLINRKYASYLERPSFRKKSLNKKLWIVESTIKNTLISERQFQIDMEILFISNDNQQRLNCSAISKMNFSKDAYLVYEIEQVISSIFKSALDNTSHYCKLVSES